MWPLPTLVPQNQTLRQELMYGQPVKKFSQEKPRREWRKQKKGRKRKSGSQSWVPFQAKSQRAAPAGLYILYNSWSLYFASEFVPTRGKKAGLLSSYTRLSLAKGCPGNLSSQALAALCICGQSGSGGPWTDL